MKRLLKKFAIVLAVACMPAVLHAQTPSVLYGRTTLQMSTSFVNSIQGLGAVITDLNNNPLQNNAITFRATGGVLNLQTSAGEIDHAGGLLVNAAGTIIRIQNLNVDTSNPANPEVTALFIFNNQFSGRLPLFNIQPPPGLTLPFQPQQGVLEVDGLMLTLAPATASALDSVFGGTVVQAGTSIGTLNSYIVLSPTN